MSLLIGESSILTFADECSAGKIEAFKYTAKENGSIENIEIHSSTVANTGVTSLVLGVYTDSAGTPGNVLGEKKITGVPATNAWISAPGLSIIINSGTQYWLALLPIGGSFHYFSKAASGGTAEKESTTTSHTKLETVSWSAESTDGPASLQGLGTALVVASLNKRSPTYYSPRNLNKPFPIAAEEIKKKQEQKLLAMLI